MAKAKKLPSGNWRAQAYSHRDANGKKHMQSFTAPTKAEAEMMAAEFAAHKKRRISTDMTVGEAIDRYIASKENVLSPSTVSGYLRMRKNYFDAIEKSKIRQLTSEEVQLFVSGLSEDLSPKSVQNIYNLFTASVGLFDPDLRFRVTLPAKKKRRPTAPSDEAVRALYKAAYPKLKICIGFGMLGLREGEISPLLYEDLEGDTIHVCKDMVRDKNGKWITKDIPKTADSDRYVKLPPFLLELIGTGSGRIVSIDPATISNRFIYLRKKLGIDMRFHDLRHFFASSAAVLGVPDIYTADFGGWQRGGKSVMKTIYQNNITSMSDYYAQKISDHMDKIIKEDA